jgi:Domain of unknown function DUF29
MSWTPDDADFYAWTQTQAAALLATDWAALDLEHLTEEIAGLGSEQEHEVESHVPMVLTHLLKRKDRPASRYGLLDDQPRSQSLHRP